MTSRSCGRCRGTGVVDVAALMSEACDKCGGTGQIAESSPNFESARESEATMNPPTGIGCRYCYDREGGCRRCGWNGTDFEALRTKRNEGMFSRLTEMAKEHDLDVSEVNRTFDPTRCYCACPEGPCEHKWDGPDYVSEDRCVCSSTCSRCGSVAMSHDMRVMP